LKLKHSSASYTPNTVGKNTLSHFQCYSTGAGVTHLFADVAHAQAKCFLIDIKIIKRPSRHQSNLLIIKNKHLKIHKYPWLQVFFVSKGIKVFMLFLENIKRPKN
jgi:hypothetical protein